MHPTYTLILRFQCGIRAAESKYIFHCGVKRKVPRTPPLGVSFLLIYQTFLQRQSLLRRKMKIKYLSSYTQHRFQIPLRRHSFKTKEYGQRRWSTCQDRVTWGPFTWDYLGFKTTCATQTIVWWRPGWVRDWVEGAKGEKWGTSLILSTIKNKLKNKNKTNCPISREDPQFCTNRDSWSLSWRMIGCGK